MRTAPRPRASTATGTPARKTMARKAAASPRKPKEDRQFVTALSRGLEILRCFTASRTELGTMELSHLTGLPQPTVWRLCYTLTALGYLSPSGDKLRIGLPVLGLGYAALAAIPFSEAARGEMQRLSADFDAAVSLAIAERDDMLIVQRAHNNSYLIVNLHVGSRLPMANSSLGWAYLAGLPAEQREKRLAALAQASGKQWETLRPMIDRALAQCARHGYLVNAGYYHPDINAVAVPVVSPDGQQVMALNCGGPASSHPMAQLEKDVAPRLLELARLIRAALPNGQPAAGLRGR